MIMQPEAQLPAGQQCMCRLAVPQRNVHANGRVTYVDHNVILVEHALIQDLKS